MPDGISRRSDLGHGGGGAAFVRCFVTGSSFASFPRSEMFTTRRSSANMGPPASTFTFTGAFLAAAAAA